MTPPAFWWRGRGVSSALLAPLAALCGAVAARRLRQPPEWWAPVPVICVGNLTVGGTGKTPTVLALAMLARRLGRRPGFLIRGYGGRVSGPLLADPSRHGPEEIGDEALLLARASPTAVGGDRVAGARRLLAGPAPVDLILMDDGFQNPGLGRDIALLVVDAATGIGNGRVVPAGPLRAPLDVQLEKADAVLVMGEGAAASGLAARAAAAGRPVLGARIVPAGPPPAGRLFAYAGIGRPEKLFSGLAAAGGGVVATRSFADHHRFTADDAAKLLRDAEAAGARLITTEKDLARLAGATGVAARLRDASLAFPVTVEFADPDALDALLRLGVARAAARMGDGPPSGSANAVPAARP